MIVITAWKHRFVWDTYLAKRDEAVPEDAFCTRNPIKFRSGTVIEVVDPANPSFIRPARIVKTTDYKIKILFLEWPNEYGFWLDDDSPCIHPIGWAKKTQHTIELPQGKIEIYSLFMPEANFILFVFLQM